MAGQNKAAAEGVAAQLPMDAVPVDAPALPCQANKDPRLKVKVFAKVKGKRRRVQATVAASALSKATAGRSAIADFSYVHPATYQVSVASISAPDDQEFYSPAGNQQQVTLAKGDRKTLELEVQPRNVITPKIEAEYKVVVFDRNLAQHQTAAGEPAADLLRPEPTYVEVSLEKSLDAPAYQGDGTLSAPNCDVFLDRDCTQALAGRKLTNAELTASPATKLYLRGTARGAFTLTLTLDASADPGVKVEAPATVDMGVVAIEFEIYEHATPVNVSATTYPLTGHCPDLEQANLIPPQVIMSDDHKVTRGRLLHVQESKHHGRAQAILKLTAAEWPAETDNYQIVLEATPADLRAYDKEVKGRQKSLPLKTKVSDLKAGDVTLWIQGSKVSDTLRAARLSVGLDRAAGGLAKSPKKNADWGRFTVVKIQSVKLEYTAPAAGQPKPWNASKRRWYINYQAGDPGRTVTIRAKLSKQLAGIKLHFMLSPDKKNLKKANWGVDLPATWTWNTITADVKQKDKTNATDLLHLSQDTDAQGQADQDLVLSRFGGDVFWPAVYISQDPHLAAYVRGHATLEDRKPKLASTEIKVWRKFAYQKVKVQGRKYPGTGTARGVYGRLRAEMHKRPSLSLTMAQVQAMALPSLLPEYMFKVKGSNRLRFNVSDANQAQFVAGIAAEGEHPLKIPVVTGDFNWANERNSAAVAGLTNIPPASFPMNVNTDVHVCDPPLQGGQLLVSGDWVAADWDPAANAGAGDWVNYRNGTLAAADVDVDRKRTSINQVRISLPAGVGPTVASTSVDITNFVVQGAPNHYLGGWGIGGNKWVVAVFDPKERTDYQNTIAHEVGHAFHQTMAGPPAGGIPGNPNYILDPTGPHCTYNVNKCVMFTSGPIRGSLNRYCPDCHPHLLVHDMSSLS